MAQRRVTNTLEPLYHTEYNCQHKIYFSKWILARSLISISFHFPARNVHSVSSMDSAHRAGRTVQSTADTVFRFNDRALIYSPIAFFKISRRLSKSGALGDILSVIVFVSGNFLPRKSTGSLLSAWLTGISFGGVTTDLGV